MHEAPKTIRKLLNRPGMFRTIGVYDALTARIAEQAGFEAVWVSGNALTAGLLAFPDIGLISFGEVIDQVRRIAQAVEIPVLVDADNGYGNPLNVIRTVREMEWAGSAGICMEDQASPKRCSLLPGRLPVINRKEAVDKVRAAVFARKNPDFIIIARTDALKGHGISEAIERANLFFEAGADMVAVEGVERVDDLKKLAAELRAPCKLQIDAIQEKTGLSFNDLERMGFKLANHAGLVRQTVVTAVREVLTELKETGDGAAILKRQSGPGVYHETLNLKQWEALEKRFSPGGDGPD